MPRVAKKFKKLYTNQKFVLSNSEMSGWGKNKGIFANGGVLGLTPLNPNLNQPHLPFCNLKDNMVPNADPAGLAKWVNKVGAEQGLWTYNAVNYVESAGSTFSASAKRGTFMCRVAEGLSELMMTHLRMSPEGHNDHRFIFLTYPDDILIGWNEMCKDALYEDCPLRSFYCHKCRIIHKCCNANKGNDPPRAHRRWSV